MWRTIFLSIVVCLASTSIISSVAADWGKCQRVSTQQDFDLTKYLGVWYEIARFDYIFEKDGVCVQANYTLNPADHSKVIVTNSEYRNGSFEQAVGEAYIPNQKEPAKILVSFGSPFFAPYWVVETDYENYAMVFSCTSLLNVYHYEVAWILSRSRQLDSSIVNKLMNKWKSFDVDVSRFSFTRQTNCKQSQKK